MTALAPVGGSDRSADALSTVRAPVPIRAARRRELLVEGLTDEEIRLRRRHGDLSSLRPGFYLSREQAQTLTGTERHRALVAGLVGDLADGSVVSHTSAAAVLGLPLWNVGLDRVHVTRPIVSGARRSTGVHVHAGGDGIPTVTMFGITVTAPARTVIDSARLVPFEQGVVIADAALHSGLVTPDELVREVERARGRKGAARARAVVAAADGRSESVGESRSRILLNRGGLLPPELQYWVLDDAGNRIARCDFGYPELRVVAEFDGEVKYGRLLRPGQQPGDVVFDEKRREDAIRELGWIVVRWVWAELRTPGVVLARVQRAIASAQRWAR